MGGAFSRSKGQRAEREVVHLLQPIVTEIYESAQLEAPALERNLMQSHKGGHDVTGLHWIAIEVKHQETLAIDAWWAQAKDQAERAAKAIGREVLPVVIYKRNRTKWKVRMFGHLPAGISNVRCPVDVSVEAFLVWFADRLKHEISMVWNERV